MSQLKYTCVNCESEKEPYFSRSEPMGFYCQDCGKNSDEIDPIDHKEIKSQLTAERALADRLADALLSTLSLWVMSQKSEEATKALAAWKEARGE